MTHIEKKAEVVERLLNLEEYIRKGYIHGQQQEIASIRKINFSWSIEADLRARFSRLLEKTGKEGDGK